MHSELDSPDDPDVVPTSLTWCKTELTISTLIFLCLHSRYTVRVIVDNEIIAEINKKMSTM